MTEQVDEHFVASVRALSGGRRPLAPLGPQLLEMFDAQLGSRQGGIWVLDQMTRWQAVNWDYSGRLQKAQIDTAGGSDAVIDLDYRLDV